MNRVLIVDDKPENLYLLKVLLQGNGCSVEEARHGAEALVKARQSPPDLIVSDLLMPVMDGYTLLRHWKADERLKAIPFIVYTATYTEPKDEQLALDLGADAFILKPAEPDVFMAKLREVFAQTQTGAAPQVRRPSGDPEHLLKDYGDVLIRKLEEKALQLEQANRALQADLLQRRAAEAEANRLREESERARKVLLGIMEDQRRAEEGRRRAEEKYREIFEHAVEGMFQTSPTGEILTANPALARILGYASPEELIRERRDLVRQGYVDPRDRENFRRRIEAEGKVSGFEYEALCKDGHRIWVSENARVVRNAHGEVLCYEGSLEDITERKRAELALLESERRFQVLAEVSPAGIFRTDAEGNTNYVNPRWCEITGLPVAEAMGTGWLRAVHPEDRARVTADWQNTTAAHRSALADYRFLRADGMIVWVMGQAVPEFDAGGAVVGYVGAITDVTERKQHETALAAQLDELRRWHDALLGRENRVLVLKEEVNALLARLGEPPRYASAVEGQETGTSEQSPVNSRPRSP